MKFVRNCNSEPIFFSVKKCGNPDVGTSYKATKETGADTTCANAASATQCDYNTVFCYNCDNNYELKATVSTGTPPATRQCVKCQADKTYETIQTCYGKIIEN